MHVRVTCAVLAVSGAFPVVLFSVENYMRNVEHEQHVGVPTCYLGGRWVVPPTPMQAHTPRPLPRPDAHAGAYASAATPPPSIRGLRPVSRPVHRASHTAAEVRCPWMRMNSLGVHRPIPIPCTTTPMHAHTPRPLPRPPPHHHHHHDHHHPQGGSHTGADGARGLRTRHRHVTVRCGATRNDGNGGRRTADGGVPSSRAHGHGVRACGGRGGGGDDRLAEAAVGTFITRPTRRTATARMRGHRAASPESADAGSPGCTGPSREAA